MAIGVGRVNWRRHGDGYLSKFSWRCSAESARARALMTASWIFMKRARLVSRDHIRRTSVRRIDSPRRETRGFSVGIHAEDIQSPRLLLRDTTATNDCPSDRSRTDIAGECDSSGFSHRDKNIPLAKAPCQQLRFIHRRISMKHGNVDTTPISFVVVVSCGS